MCAQLSILWPILEGYSITARYDGLAEMIHLCFAFWNPLQRTIDLRTHDDDEETLNYEYYRNSRLVCPSVIILLSLFLCWFEASRISLKRNEWAWQRMRQMLTRFRSRTPHTCVKLKLKWIRNGLVFGGYVDEFDEPVHIWGTVQRLHVIFTFPCGRDMKCSEEGHSVRVNAGFKKFGVDKIWAAFF